MKTANNFIKMFFLCLCLCAGPAADESYATGKASEEGNGGGAAVGDTAGENESPVKPEYIEAMRIPEEVRAAIKKSAPGFEMWKLEDYKPVDGFKKYYPYSAEQFPNEIKGDFNGDGKTDYAVSGHSGEYSLILTVMDTPYGYEVVPYRYVMEDSREKDDFLLILFLIPKGGIYYGYDEEGEREKKTASADMISMSYVWSNYDQPAVRPESGVYSGDFFLGLSEIIYYSHADETKPDSSDYKEIYGRGMELSDNMKKALYGADKDFVMWRLEDYPDEVLEEYGYSGQSMPNILKGDFNNDGKEDRIVSGHDEEENRVYAVLSSTAGYRARALKADIFCSFWNDPCLNMKGKADGKIHPAAVLQLYGKKDVFYEAYYSYPYVGGRPDFKLKRELFGIKHIDGCGKILMKGRSSYEGVCDYSRSGYPEVFVDICGSMVYAD